MRLARQADCLGDVGQFGHAALGGLAYASLPPIISTDPATTYEIWTTVCCRRKKLLASELEFYCQASDTPVDIPSDLDTSPKKISLSFMSEKASEIIEIRIKLL